MNEIYMTIGMLLQTSNHWIPTPIGTPSNERADTAANEACNQFTLTNYVAADD